MIRTSSQPDISFIHSRTHTYTHTHTRKDGKENFKPKKKKLMSFLVVKQIFTIVLREAKFTTSQVPCTVVLFFRSHDGNASDFHAFLVFNFHIIFFCFCWYLPNIFIFMTSEPLEKIKDLFWGYVTLVGFGGYVIQSSQ